MKKNVMMRLASFLLVAVLISTSAISGTYAKYVTQTEGSDSARVARWGVEFVTSSDLFATQYKYDTTQNGVTGTYSVVSKAGGDVVAPGTEGNGYNFTTVGDPEVSYKVTFDVKDSADTETIFLDDYYPVEFTLTNGTDDVTITDPSIEELVESIENYCYMYDVDKEEYYVSTDKGVNWTSYGAEAPELDLSWKWEFEQDKDVEDTTLGYIAAGETVDGAKTMTGYAGTGNYNLEIAFTVVATATQIN